MIAIAATFTAEPLAGPLQAWLQAAGYEEELAFAPYGQLFQQLAAPGSVLRTASMRIVLLRSEDWLRQAGAEEAPARAALLRRAAEDLCAGLRGARDGKPWLVCLLPPSPDAAAEARAVEVGLATELAGESGVTLLPAAELLARYPCRAVHDPHADFLGHVPYTPELFAALAASLTRTLYGLRARPKKVIVVDCDHTLWHGVVGEDGPTGIVVTPPHAALQRFLQEKMAQGFVLAIASRNDEPVVWEAFARCEGMLLGREDFVAWRIDWQPKSQNLRAIAEELAVGLDSLVFIDDDPVQCAEVRARCPEVLTIPFRADAEVADFLAHVWAFDRRGTTAEDRQRTRMYLDERERREARRGLQLRDFVAGLELEVGFEPVGAGNVERVVQLLRRTNQFNLRPRRFDRAGLEQWLAEASSCGFAVRVRDRFGDYGLVGVILARELPDALAVEVFLLSCRVLGRGVEHRMLAWLGARATGPVRLPCERTERNRPAQQFFARFAEHPDADVAIIPAAVAAAARFDPDAEEAGEAGEAGEAEKAEEAGEGPAAHSTSADRSERLCRFAELRTGQAILAWLRETSGSAGGPAPVAYRDAVEATVAGIVAGLLERDQVPAAESFYALGGGSLLGLQALAAIATELGVELPIDVLFADTCSVASLADAVRAASPAATGESG